MSERSATTVAVLMFDGAGLFEMSVPTNVFGVYDGHADTPRFALLAVSATPGPVRTTGGVELYAPHGLDVLDRAGVVVVPSWRIPPDRPDEPVLEALRAAHADGATILGLCLGAFVVAAAGLLDDRRATTHWHFAPNLAADYPRVRVDPSVLYVDEGDVLTSAGTAAGIDACLHLVRREFGARAATRIARRMIVAPQRSGGQAQYIQQPVPEPASDLLGDTLAYALANLDATLDVDALAARARMSRRSFDRRFAEVVGTSPLQWLVHQRVFHAQQLLEQTDLSVDAVSHRVGFASGTAMRPHFRRIVGVPPQRYRETFGAQSRPRLRPR